MEIELDKKILSNSEYNDILESQCFNLFYINNIYMVFDPNCVNKDLYIEKNINRSMIVPQVGGKHPDDAIFAVGITPTRTRYIVEKNAGVINYSGPIFIIKSELNKKTVRNPIFNDSYNYFGKGGQTAVFQLEDIRTAKKYVLKITVPLKNFNITKYRQDRLIPNFVPYVPKVYYAGNLHMYNDFVAGNDRSAYVKPPYVTTHAYHIMEIYDTEIINKPFNTKLKIFNSLTLALRILEENNYACTDLKPDNIGIDENGNSVFIDYTESTFCDVSVNTFRSSGVSATPMYMPNKELYFDGKGLTMAFAALTGANAIKFSCFAYGTIVFKLFYNVDNSCTNEIIDQIYNTTTNVHNTATKSYIMTVCKNAIKYIKDNNYESVELRNIKRTGILNFDINAVDYVKPKLNDSDLDWLVIELDRLKISDLLMYIYAFYNYYNNQSPYYDKLSYMFSKYKFYNDVPINYRKVISSLMIGQPESSMPPISDGRPDKKSVLKHDTLDNLPTYTEIDRYIKDNIDVEDNSIRNIEDDMRNIINKIYDAKHLTRILINKIPDKTERQTFVQNINFSTEKILTDLKQYIKGLADKYRNQEIRIEPYNPAQNYTCTNCDYYTTDIIINSDRNIDHTPIQPHISKNIKSDHNITLSSVIIKVNKEVNNEENNNDYELLASIYKLLKMETYEILEIMLKMHGYQQISKYSWKEPIRLQEYIFDTKFLGNKLKEYGFIKFPTNIWIKR